MPRLPESAAAVERMSWSDSSGSQTCSVWNRSPPLPMTAGRRSYVNESLRSVKAGDGYFETHSTRRGLISRASRLTNG